MPKDTSETESRRKEQAIEEWGKSARETKAAWSSYPKEKQAEILAEAEDIYRRLLRMTMRTPPAMLSRA